MEISPVFLLTLVLAVPFVFLIGCVKEAARLGGRDRQTNGRKEGLFRRKRERETDYDVREGMREKLIGGSGVMRGEIPVICGKGYL